MRAVASMAVMVLVVAACADDSSGDTTTSSPTASTIGQTTTTATPDTTTSIPSSTTTLVVWADTAVAEGLIHAIFDEDDTAIEALPSVSNRAKVDATQRRDFNRAVNGVLVETTCEIADPALVSCLVVGSDDISSALGSDSFTEQWDFDFNSEWILDFSPNETDDEYGAFFGWAFDTYPNICDTPAQCALALFDVTDEYLDPAAVLADYLEVWNADDAEAVMVFYAEDAVLEGHPEDTGDVSTGKLEIFPIEQRMQIHQESTGFFEFINIEVSGDTVTFDSIFHNGDGDCFSSAGHEVTVADNKITLFVWGELDAGLCP